jgi:hypothetical protein
MPRPANEALSASVINLDAFLGDVVADASSFLSDRSLWAALSSQGALAKYANPSRNIAPISLNTLKRKSDELLESGFHGLNELRVKAREVLEAEAAKGARANQRTKGALLQQISELKDSLNASRRDTVRLTAAIYDTIRYGRICASQANNEAASLQFEKHMQEVLSRFALPKTPGEG